MTRAIMKTREAVTAGDNSKNEFKVQDHLDNKWTPSAMAKTHSKRGRPTKNSTSGKMLKFDEEKVLPKKALTRVKKHGRPSKNVSEPKSFTPIKGRKRSSKIVSILNPSTSAIRCKKQNTGLLMPAIRCKKQNTGLLMPAKRRGRPPKRLCKSKSLMPAKRCVRVPKGSSKPKPSTLIKRRESPPKGKIKKEEQYHVMEDLDDKNLADEDLADKDLADENLADKHLFDEDLVHTNRVDEDRDEENLNEENLNEENLDEEIDDEDVEEETNDEDGEEDIGENMPEEYPNEDMNEDMNEEYIINDEIDEGHLGDEEIDEEDLDHENLYQDPNLIPPNNFTILSNLFVIRTTDIDENSPFLWKIVGKGKLQKFIPFVYDGKLLYMNTSTYKTWEFNNEELYYPTPVSYIQKSDNESIVEFDKAKIIKSPVLPLLIEYNDPSNIKYLTEYDFYTNNIDGASDVDSSGGIHTIHNAANDMYESYQSIDIPDENETVDNVNETIDLLNESTDTSDAFDTLDANEMVDQSNEHDNERAINFIPPPAQGYFGFGQSIVEIRYFASARHSTSYDSLNEYRNFRCKEFCDITVIVGDTKFPAHISVLDSQSPYFHRILSSFNAERFPSFSTEYVLYISELTEESFSLLMDFMYTAHLTINYYNVKDLLIGSIVLVLNDVKEKCLTFFKHVISFDNLMDIRDFACSNKIDELCNIVKSFTLIHFSDVVSSEFFLTASYDFVAEILMNNQNYGVENQVYKSFILWVNHDLTSRTKHIPEFLEAIS